MNKTIAHGGLCPGARPRAPLLHSLTGAAALLPAAAAAAPLSTGTQVSLLWPAFLGAALLILSTLYLKTWLRLRRTAAEGAQRAAALKDENSRAYQQLKSYSDELASRERQLAEARERIDQLEHQHQESADLLALVGHHLRQPLDALQSTLSLLARGSAGRESAQLVAMAQRQLQSSLQSLAEIGRSGGVETIELTLPGEKGAAPGGQSILLVENDNLESLRGALESRGHKVQRENNGVDGADAALQKRFDLVLLDSQLPLMDGIETTQKIRRGAGPDLPVFALLAEPRAGDKERYRARGLSGVLPRPVTDYQVQQLLDWIERRASGAGAGKKPARPTRLLNTGTLCRQRDTLGHLSFAELLSERCATLPKRITALTSALTGRHWLDAEKLAQTIATSTEEIGLEAVTARLRAVAARLSIDNEREYCRHQRTELLNLMRASIQQLKAWREKNVHTEWALK